LKLQIQLARKMSGPPFLADVPTEELMRELAHRLECTKKPEKRIILIGPPGESLMMLH